MAASLVAGGTGAAYAAGADWERYAITEQGSDRATFDRSEGDFEVCDNEKDDHPMYAKFSATEEDDLYYYDRSGAGGDCAYFLGTNSGEAGVMYICEEDWGWDSCSNGVVTYWHTPRHSRATPRP